VSLNKHPKPVRGFFYALANFTVSTIEIMENTVNFKPFHTWKCGILKQTKPHFYLIFHTKQPQ
jgi:hypothetical protein